MYRKRLQICGSRYVYVRKTILRKAERELAVHTACRPESGTGGESADICAAIAKIGIVRNCHHDLVCTLLEHTSWNGQLKRRGESGAECNEVSVDPHMHLIANALECENGGTITIKFDNSAVEEASVDIRKSRVGSVVENRELLYLVKRIDAEFILDSGSSECRYHILPIPRHRTSNYFAIEGRLFDIFPFVRLICHLPCTVQRDGIVDAVLERFGGIHYNGHRSKKRH